MIQSYIRYKFDFMPMIKCTCDDLYLSTMCTGKGRDCPNQNRDEFTDFDDELNEEDQKNVKEASKKSKERKLRIAKAIEEDISKQRSTLPIQQIPKGLDDSSIKKFKGFELLKDYETPSLIVHKGVCRWEEEWREFFHDEDLDCKIKTDWFKPQYSYEFKSQEELDMYISAYFEVNFDNIKNSGFEEGRKQAIETIEQYPGRRGINAFKNDIRHALKNRFRRLIFVEKLERIRNLIETAQMRPICLEKDLLNEILRIIKEIPETLDDNK